MATRDQPYIPLMVKDWLTDEKLTECAASSYGVYSVLMCRMHKSKEYGTILLQQKDQQTNDQIENFAVKLQKVMPFPMLVIYDALTELILEDVIQFDEKKGKLSQKRMIKDNNISLARSNAGSKGGFATAKKTAKRVANTVTATANVNGIEDVIKEVIPYEEIIKDLNLKAKTNYKHTTQKTKDAINARFNEGFKLEDFFTVHDKKVKEWLNTDYSKFLRPETLYSNKFEGYLNQLGTPEKKEEKKINFKDEWSQVQSCFIGGNKKERAEILPSEIKKVIIQMRGITEIGNMSERDGFFKYIETRKELTRGIG
jgi:uncharacterized phage protein (TIGR02220 family)